MVKTISEIQQNICEHESRIESVEKDDPVVVIERFVKNAGEVADQDDYEKGETLAGHFPGF